MSLRPLGLFAILVRPLQPEILTINGYQQRPAEISELLIGKGMKDSLKLDNTNVLIEKPRNVSQVFRWC
jgi:hypothetical protein